MSSEFIQILHNGNDHWITVSTIGAKESEVLIYDSLFSYAPEKLKEQVAALLYTQKEAITLKFMKVDLQTNGSDCGIYAIAYATALCFGKSPGLLRLDDSKMRAHLIKCLEQGEFTIFLVCQTSRQVQVNYILCVSHALTSQHRND